MNFGQNFYDWLLDNLQPIVLVVVIGGIVYLCAKREFSKVIVAMIVGVIAIGMIYKPTDTKGVFVSLYDKVILQNVSGDSDNGDSDSSDKGK